MTYFTDNSRSEALFFRHRAARDGEASPFGLEPGIACPSAAFADVHASGANPAANAALADLAFTADRGAIVQPWREIG